jgi:hypothetical protein
MTGVIFKNEAFAVQIYRKSGAFLFKRAEMNLEPPFGIAIGYLALESLSWPL